MKKPKKMTFLLFLVLIMNFILCSCGSSSLTDGMDSSGMKSESVMEDSAMVPGESNGSIGETHYDTPGSETGSGSGEQQNVSTNRKIITTISMYVETNHHN